MKHAVGTTALILAITDDRKHRGKSGQDGRLMIFAVRDDRLDRKVRPGWPFLIFAVKDDRTNKE